MKNRFNFYFDGTYPAILPEAQTVWNFGKIAAAIGYFKHDDGIMLKQINASVLQDDQCAALKEYQDQQTPNTQICIEDICYDGNEICDLCDYGVNFSIKKTFSNSLNLIVDAFFQTGDFILYQVFPINRLEVIGLPKWCKKEGLFRNQVTNKDEKRSATVYTNIRYFVPWIKKILSSRCSCTSTNTTSVNCDQCDCIEYIIQI